MTNSDSNHSSTKSAAALSAFPALLPSRARAAGGEIVIGFITSMSGPVSSLGTPYD